MRVFCVCVSAVQARKSNSSVTRVLSLLTFCPPGPLERAKRASVHGLRCSTSSRCPLPAIHRLPFTTWRRLGQSIEGTDTVAIVVGQATEPQPER